MTEFNLVGVRFPIDHVLFSEDEPLKNKLKKISALVEIKGDMRQAKEAVDSLAFSHNKEREMLPMFGSIFPPVRESLLAFAVVSYARAFNKSDGKTNLGGEIKNIFLNNNEFLATHSELISLRNKFYAHRGSEYNNYDVMCLVTDEKVRINPESSVRRVLFAYQLDKEKSKFFIELLDYVMQYLDSEIKNICRNIENHLSDEQSEHIKQIPRSNVVLKN